MAAITAGREDSAASAGKRRASSSSKGGRAAFGQPEGGAFGIGEVLFARDEYFGFHQPRYHRPIFVDLRLLGGDQIVERHDVDYLARRGLKDNSALPQVFEAITPAHRRHHVDAQSVDAFGARAMMNGVPATQIGFVEGGEEHQFGVEFAKGPFSSRQV